MTDRELLENPDAVLDTTDLARMGYSQKAINAIYRAAEGKSGVEKWPGFRRPMIRASDFVELREQYTYRGDRVRPS